MAAPHHSTNSNAVRPRPALFRALGHAEPPEVITVAGQVCRRLEIFKHDSWAATALYQGPKGLVVCKFNRIQPILGVPMSWLGRWLARHEGAVLLRLADLPNVPRLAGTVAEGLRILPHAVARRYVPGHPLRRGEAVGERFFARLDQLLREMHARDLAYVDLHKRENVLVGHDGQPHLIDFQVSFLLPESRWANFAPVRWLLRQLQAADRYHALKHFARHQQGTAAAKAGVAAARPLWLRIHRRVAKPLRELRRRLLVLLGIRQGPGRASSEHFPEDAVRQETLPQAA